MAEPATNLLLKSGIEECKSGSKICEVKWQIKNGDVVYIKKQDGKIIQFVHQKCSGRIRTKDAALAADALYMEYSAWKFLESKLGFTFVPKVSLRYNKQLGTILRIDYSGFGIKEIPILEFEAQFDIRKIDNSLWDTTNKIRKFSPNI